MSAHRSAKTSTLVQNQNDRPVLLGTVAPAGSATNFGLPPWSIESVECTLGTVSQVPVLLGAQLWISSTADINIRLRGSGGAVASGTVTYVAPSGAQTIVLGGRTVSFTAQATATDTAVAAVAALSADQFIAHAFNLSNAAGVVTIKSIIKSTGMNVTLTATGTGATAGGATLTGGTDATAGTTASNSFIVPAKVLFPIYKVAGDTFLDILGTATVNIFVGV